MVCFFFQCLNENTKTTDTSGNEWKVKELLRLAYHFMVNDCSKIFKQKSCPIDVSDAKIMMVLPTRWNDKSQKIIKESVQKVTKISIRTSLLGPFK